MTLLKIRRSSQCHKTTILRIMFKIEKSLLRSGIVQRPVSAGSHKLSWKTTRPN